MVDWVCVRILRGSPEDPGGLSQTTSKGRWLEDNGDIMPGTGFTSTLQVGVGRYYLEVQHRNHLSILSSVPLKLQPGQETAFNFTNIDSAYESGGTALRNRGSGNYTMWAGDGDQNGTVTSFDFLNVWLPENGTPDGYKLSDFNLDGSVTAFDFLEAWLPANGQQSQTP